MIDWRVPTPPSWLFVRDNQSIWIARTGLTMTVSGPGRSHVRCEFDGEDQLQQFQMGLAEQFARDGWVLEDSSVDRRGSGDCRSPLHPHCGDDRRRRPHASTMKVVGRAILEESTALR
jgi:hypothetical protein